MKSASAYLLPSPSVLNREPTTPSPITHTDEYYLLNTFSAYLLPSRSVLVRAPSPNLFLRRLQFGRLGRSPGNFDSGKLLFRYNSQNKKHCKGKRHDGEWPKCQWGLEAGCAWSDGPVRAKQRLENGRTMCAASVRHIVGSDEPVRCG